MADNVTTQSSTLSTVPADTKIATYEILSHSGETAHIAPTVLGTVASTEGTRTFTDISAANPLPISDAAGSITVDGTVAVSGTVAVTDNAGSLTVDAPVGTPAFVRLSDGSAAISTLPVSLASVPSHAVTNAGTFVVQENGAALTALQLIDNAISGTGVNVSQLNGVNVTMGNGASGTGVQRVTLASDSTGILAAVTNVATIGTSVTPGTSAAHLGKAVDSVAGATDTGVLMLAVRDDALTTLTPVDGDYTQLRVSSTGALHVTGAAGTTQYVEDVASSGGESVVLLGAIRQDTIANDTTADGDYQRLKADSVGALYVTGSAGTAVQLDDAAFTPGTSRVANLGFFADEASTDSVDEGDSGAARMTLDRKQIVTPYPHTAGGLLIHKSLDLDESEEEVKGTAGQLYGWWITNAATSVRYVKFYNATAASVTVGTTTPVFTLPIPAAASGTVAANALGAHGITFDTAISVAATTGLADNDTGAPGANEVIVALFYK
jgi:hypothetical protein